MQSIVIKPSGAVATARVVLLGLFTLLALPLVFDRGAFVFALLLLALPYGFVAWLHAVTPRSADVEGLTMGFGKRLLWKELMDVQVIRQELHGATVNHRLVMRFPNGVARFGIAQCENGWEALAFIERTLGRKLLSA